MQFNLIIPTKIYFGVGCISQNAAEFEHWGKRALVVTGRKSAKASGALADVIKVFRERNIIWEVFDQIEENPSLTTVENGGDVARRFKPDMIVAIGGGSPLDAAKAIAVLAVNTIRARELFDSQFAVTPLPVLAIPLTAGTGSEVTQYSILTDPDRQTKRSFAEPSVFPKVAFLDARYTETQKQDVTNNTAVDALSHAIEGYMSKRSTCVTDCLALESIRAFGAVRNSLLTGECSLADREKLLYASLLGGIVIAQTGTTAVHALGYSLTYFNNVPHGRANGILLGEYLRFNEAVVPEKTRCVLQAVGVASITEFKQLMSDLLPSEEVYTEREVEKFAQMAVEAKNTANTPRQPSVVELQRMLKASVSMKQ